MILIALLCNKYVFFGEKDEKLSPLESTVTDIIQAGHSLCSLRQRKLHLFQQPPFKPIEEEYLIVKTQNLSGVQF